jgi:hypothetical protein
MKIELNTLHHMRLHHVFFAFHELIITTLGNKQENMNRRNSNGRSQIHEKINQTED